jgi:hypothetical protein
VSKHSNRPGISGLGAEIRASIAARFGATERRVLTRGKAICEMTFNWKGAGMNIRRAAVLVLLTVVGVSTAQAQWVMVARAVSGRVQRMEQQRSANNGGYDVASVILEAQAANVYDTAVKTLKAHSDKVTVTTTDAKKMIVKFTDGQQIASLQVTSLGPKVTQLMIASNAVESGQSGTSIVLQGVLKVCKEMNVNCTVEQ